MSKNCIVFFSLKNLEPQKFYRFSCIFSLVWLLLLYPALNHLSWQKSPIEFSESGEDFGQYYSGALVARYGIWDQLYPTPEKKIDGQNPNSHPKFQIPLCKNIELQHQVDYWSYFESIASPKNSKISPDLKSLYPRLQTDWHYIYPPPLAILLWPIGYLDYKEARYLWFSILSASLFGLGYLASLIYRKLRNEISYFEGFIVLFPAIVQIYLYTTNTTSAIDLGNSSPLLGFFIALVTYAWITNKQFTMGLGMVPLLLFKGMGLGWCPLLFVKPIKWKSISILAFSTFIINGIFVMLGGIKPFEIFFSEIMPKANVALGDGLQGQILSLFGLNLKILFLTLNFALNLFLIFGYWRQSVACKSKIPEIITISALSGSVAIFVLCNPIVWPHYYFSYIIFPFLGVILIDLKKVLLKKKLLIFVFISYIVYFQTRFSYKIDYLVVPEKFEFSPSGGV